MSYSLSHGPATVEKCKVYALHVSIAIEDAVLRAVYSRLHDKKFVLSARRLTGSRVIPSPCIDDLINEPVPLAPEQNLLQLFYNPFFALVILVQPA